MHKPSNRRVPIRVCPELSSAEWGASLLPDHSTSRPGSPPGWLRTRVSSLSWAFRSRRLRAPEQFELILPTPLGASTFWMRKRGTRRLPPPAMDDDAKRGAEVRLGPASPAPRASYGLPTRQGRQSEYPPSPQGLSVSVFWLLNLSAKPSVPRRRRAWKMVAEQGEGGEPEDLPLSPGSGADIMRPTSGA